MTLNLMVRVLRGSIVLVGRPSVRYADLGGIENVLQDIRELIEVPPLSRVVASGEAHPCPA